MRDLAELVALQHEDGSFPSVIAAPEGRRPDRNGFVTALVVRGLRHCPASALSGLRERALAFILRCRSAQVAGAFGFWPDAARPAWAAAVPADADDTAIMLGELLRHGWFDRKAVLRSVCTALLPFRVRPGEFDLAPPWVGAGCFPTWLAPPGRGRPNVVDCCVNANVAALLAQVGARHLPGYAEAVRTVSDGIGWARSDARRLASLTPFYPSPQSLFEALEHAVECGAGELADALAALPASPRDRSGAVGEATAGECRGAYSSTVWHSTALACVRRLHGARPGAVAS